MKTKTKRLLVVFGVLLFLTGVFAEDVSLEVILGTPQSPAATSSSTTEIASQNSILDWLWAPFENFLNPQTSTSSSSDSTTLEPTDSPRAVADSQPAIQTSQAVLLVQSLVTEEGISVSFSPKDFSWNQVQFIKILVGGTCVLMSYNDPANTKLFSPQQVILLPYSNLVPSPLQRITSNSGQLFTPCTGDATNPSGFYDLKKQDNYSVRVQANNTNTGFLAVGSSTAKLTVSEENAPVTTGSASSRETLEQIQILLDYYYSNPSEQVCNDTMKQIEGLIFLADCENPQTNACDFALQSVSEYNQAYLSDPSKDFQKCDKGLYHIANTVNAGLGLGLVEEPEIVEPKLSFGSLLDESGNAIGGNTINPVRPFGVELDNVNAQKRLYLFVSEAQSPKSCIALAGRLNDFAHSLSGNERETFLNFSIANASLNDFRGTVSKTVLDGYLAHAYGFGQTNSAPLPETSKMDSALFGGDESVGTDFSEQKFFSLDDLPNSFNTPSSVSSKELVSSKASAWKLIQINGQVLNVSNTAVQGKKLVLTACQFDIQTAEKEFQIRLLGEDYKSVSFGANACSSIADCLALVDEHFRVGLFPTEFEAANEKDPSKLSIEPAADGTSVCLMGVPVVTSKPGEPKSTDTVEVLKKTSVNGKTGTILAGLIQLKDAVNGICILAKDKIVPTLKDVWIARIFLNGKPVEIANTEQPVAADPFLVSQNPAPFLKKTVLLRGTVSSVKPHFLQDNSKIGVINLVQDYLEIDVALYNLKGQPTLVHGLMNFAGTPKTVDGTVRADMNVKIAGKVDYADNANGLSNLKIIAFEVQEITRGELAKSWEVKTASTQPASTEYVSTIYVPNSGGTFIADYRLENAVGKNALVYGVVLPLNDPFYMQKLETNKFGPNDIAIALTDSTGKVMKMPFGENYFVRVKLSKAQTWPAESLVSVGGRIDSVSPRFKPPSFGENVLDFTFIEITAEVVNPLQVQ